MSDIKREPNLKREFYEYFALLHIPEGSAAYAEIREDLTAILDAILKRDFPDQPKYHEAAIKGIKLFNKHYPELEQIGYNKWLTKEFEDNHTQSKKKLNRS